MSTRARVFAQSAEPGPGAGGAGLAVPVARPASSTLHVFGSHPAPGCCLQRGLLHGQGVLHVDCDLCCGACRSSGKGLAFTGFAKKPSRQTLHIPQLKQNTATDKKQARAVGSSLLDNLATNPPKTQSGMQCIKSVPSALSEIKLDPRHGGLQGAAPRRTSGTHRAVSMVQEAQKQHASTPRDHAASPKACSSPVGSAFHDYSGTDHTRPDVIERRPEKRPRMIYGYAKTKPLQIEPRKVDTGSFYANPASSRAHRPAVTCSTSGLQRKKDDGPIDLTADSDDDCVEEVEEKTSKCEEDAMNLTRDHLFQLTGSVESGTSMEDTLHGVKSSGEDAFDVRDEQDESQCEFLRRHFAGLDDALLSWCSRPEIDVQDTEAMVIEKARQARRQKSGVSCSIRHGGMGAFDLKESHLMCLRNREWLNDEVINAYMSLLALRSELCWKRYRQRRASEAGDDQQQAKESEAEDTYESTQEVMDSYGESDDVEEKRDAQWLQCDDLVGGADEAESKKVDAPTRSAFFSSFFYALLRNAKNGYNYANVQRWSRKKQLEQMDRILFPINISNAHWCLAVVYPKEMKIKYFDSLGGKNSHCLKLLTRYMQDEGKARGIDAWTSEWATECVAPPQCPKQLDG